jgi:hypothetical protein
LADQSVEVGKSLIYSLPSYYDIGGSSISIELSVDFGDANAFISQ